MTEMIEKDKDLKDSIVLEIFEKTGVKVTRNDPTVDLVSSIIEHLSQLDVSLDERLKKFDSELNQILDNSLSLTRNELEEIHQILIEYFDNSLSIVEQKKNEIDIFLERIKDKENDIAKDVYILVKKEIANDIGKILDNELRKITEYVVNNQVNNANKQRNILVGISIGVVISVLVALLFIFVLK